MEVNAEPFPLTLVKMPVVAPILPTLALPVTFKEPVMLALVELIVRTLAVPATPTVTLPFDVDTETLLVPLLIELPDAVLLLSSNTNPVEPITIGSLVVNFHCVSL
jgi:hypothetical protein